jgi:hypothetical protein
MGEVAVKAAGDPEHPDHIGRYGNAKGGPTKARKEHKETGQMHTDKGPGADPVRLLIVL